MSSRSTSTSSPNKLIVIYISFLYRIIKKKFNWSIKVRTYEGRKSFEVNLFFCIPNMKWFFSSSFVIVLFFVNQRRVYLFRD